MKNMFWKFGKRCKNLDNKRQECVCEETIENCESCACDLVVVVSGVL